MSNLIPVEITYTELADILDDMARRVREGDSWEGHIEYVLPEEPSATPTVLVRGLYRTGNRMGQGGVRMYGRPPAYGGPPVPPAPGEWVDPT